MRRRIYDFNLYYHIGNIEYYLEKYEDSYLNLLQALESLEKRRNVIKDTDSRILFSSRKTFIHDMAVEAALKIKRPVNEILSIIDKAKSRTFNEMLLNKSAFHKSTTGLRYIKELSIVNKQIDVIMGII